MDGGVGSACGICYHPYTISVINFCGHGCCLECARKLHATDTEGRVLHQKKCYYCRQSIENKIFTVYNTTTGVSHSYTEYQVIMDPSYGRLSGEPVTMREIGGLIAQYTWQKLSSIRTIFKYKDIVMLILLILV
ncbi:MAG: hypothetical protein F2563_01575 [Actinobacteria bacterium]|nr:hypothetical protein [Actinomycetota bacterium]